MTTIRLSWVSLMHGEMSTVTLKFGLPVIVSRDTHKLKQAPLDVEF